MEYNVFQLLKDPIGSTRSYEVADTIATEDGAEYDITGSVELLHTNRGILVRANLSTFAKLMCSRCLQPLSCPVPIRFEEEFLPSINISDGKGLDLQEEAGYFKIDNKHILSLKEAVKEYLVLNMPMKPLCKEDCAGLCPVCGQNLNEGSCLCESSPVEGRWAPLYSLSLKKSRKGYDRS